MKNCVGVLALQGDVFEHFVASQKAIKNLKLKVRLIPVRTKEELSQVDALIVPGGESTVLHKLCVQADIFEAIKKVPYIFGTCAGAIMLAKNIQNKTADQKTFELMDVTIDRNGYGRQTDSFEKEIKTELGKINAIFIRAPRIKKVGLQVKILAKLDDEVVACEENVGGKYYLAACFHPEMSSTIFHEYFLRRVYIDK